MQSQATYIVKRADQALCEISLLVFTDDQHTFVIKLIKDSSGMRLETAIIKNMINAVTIEVTNCE